MLFFLVHLYWLSSGLASNKCMISFTLLQREICGRDCGFLHFLCQKYLDQKLHLWGKTKNLASNAGGTKSEPHLMKISRLLLPSQSFLFGGLFPLLPLPPSNGLSAVGIQCSITTALTILSSWTAFFFFFFSFPTSLKKNSSWHSQRRLITDDSWSFCAAEPKSFYYPLLLNKHLLLFSRLL